MRSRKASKKASPRRLRLKLPSDPYKHVDAVHEKIAGLDRKQMQSIARASTIAISNEINRNTPKT